MLLQIHQQLRLLIFFCIGLFILCCGRITFAEDCELGGRERPASDDLRMIDYRELLKIFAVEKTVKCRNIRGEDLTRIVKETDYPISISNSVIIKGWEFAAKDLREESTGLRHYRYFPLKNSITIRNAIINEIDNVDTDSANERNAVSIKGIQFQEPVVFDNVQFEGTLDLGNNYFQHNLNVNRSFIGEQFILLKSRLSKNINLDFTRFVGSVNLNLIKVSGGFSAKYAKFNEEVSGYSGAYCRGFTVYRSSFEGSVNFSRTRFHGHPTLRASYAQPVQLQHSTFYKGLWLFGQKMHSLLDLSEARFKYLTFDGRGSYTVMPGRVDLRSVRTGRIRFKNISFLKEVDFSSIYIGEVKSLDDQGLVGRADYCEVNKSKRSTRITRQPKSAPAKLEHAIWMENVTYENDVNFVRAKFPTSIHFNNVRFKGTTDFTDMRLIPVISGMKLKQDFKVSYLLFEKARLNWGQLPQSYYLSTIKDGQKRSAIYKGFENMFRRQKQLGDANHVMHLGELALRDELKEQAIAELLTLQKKTMIQEDPEEQTNSDQPQQNTQAGETSPAQQTFTRKPRIINAVQASANPGGTAEKNNKPGQQTTVPRTFWGTLRSIGIIRALDQAPAVMDVLFAEIKWVFWGLPTGYGTKFWRILLVSAALGFIFMLLLRRYAHISWRWHSRTAGGSWFRPFDLPSAYTHDFAEEFVVKARHQPWLDSLRLTVLLLFKVGRGEVVVKQGRGRLSAVWLLRLEWLVGYFTVAALLYTLGNTQPLLKALIGAVF